MKTLNQAQLDYLKLVEETPELALWGGDPECDHEPVPACGGGVKCKHCPGWFCF